MGFFKRNSKRDDLKTQQLVRDMQEAKAGLIAEQARGYLIDWRNNFLRLERITNGDIQIDEDIKPIFVANVVDECAAFINAYALIDSVELYSVVRYLEHQLSEAITYYSFQIVQRKMSVADAITVLARCNEIEKVIAYIDSLEKDVYNLALHTNA